MRRLNQILHYQWPPIFHWSPRFGGPLQADFFLHQRPYQTDGPGHNVCKNWCHECLPATAGSSSWSPPSGSEMMETTVYWFLHTLWASVHPQAIKHFSRLVVMNSRAPACDTSRVLFRWFSHHRSTWLSFVCQQPSNDQRHLLRFLLLSRRWRAHPSA